MHGCNVCQNMLFIQFILLFCLLKKEVAEEQPEAEKTATVGKGYKGKHEVFFAEKVH